MPDSPSNDARAAGLLIDAVRRLASEKTLDGITAIVKHTARQLVHADGATFVLRSGDLATTRYRENFLATTAKLAAHPALARCELTTPAEAVARWRAARRTAGD